MSETTETPQPPEPTPEPDAEPTHEGAEETEAEDNGA
jgi:hypothetical protein